MLRWCYRGTGAVEDCGQVVRQPIVAVGESAVVHLIDQLGVMNENAVRALLASPRCRSGRSYQSVQWYEIGLPIAGFG
jgi:hypothetical protein